MFYEEFITDIDPDDKPAGEYLSDDLKIRYYLQNISDGPDDLCKLINHEWLHGLFDWATEGEDDPRYMVDPDKDHHIMKVINFGE